MDSELRSGSFLRIRTVDGHRVWWIDLDEYADGMRIHDVSPAARARAERLLDPLDRRRFLASRHALGSILTGLLGKDPRFVDEGQGRPRLDPPILELSSSRSGRHALIGVSRDAPIGVDIEMLRPVPEASGIVRDHFAASEQIEWNALDPDARDEAFLVAWTRKEAVAKAVGQGIGLPFESIAVGCSPSARTVSARTISARAVNAASSDGTWRVRVRTLPLDGTCVAAVATVALPNPHRVEL